MQKIIVYADTFTDSAIKFNAEKQASFNQKTLKSTMLSAVDIIPK